MSIALSLVIGSCCALQPISLKKNIGYASSVSILACLLWGDHTFYYVLLLETCFVAIGFRHALKSYFMALSIRYLLLATSFLLYGGSFHNLLWFVPMKKGIIILWLLYILVFVLLIIKWKDVFARLSYLYDVRVYAGKEKFKIKSYLDSGNLLTHEKLPVLFLASKYQTYFKNQHIELIVMNTIKDTQIIRCYECEIQLPGCKKHRVYVNCDKTLHLPFRCEMLLNMKVMTMG